MILFLKHDVTMLEIEHLQQRLQFMGLESVLEIDDNNKVLAVTHGCDDMVCLDDFAALPHVEKVAKFSDNFKLVGNDIKKQGSVIQIKNHTIGGQNFMIMAGPCSIESREQLFAIAESVKNSGATVLRGGAFKPRTSPYDFQGLGEIGLQYMREAADAFDLLCVSEVMCPEDVSMVASYVDILQLGARNMQNYNLLKAVGKSDKAVLLKRGLCATYKEFLSAAEYIMSAGNPNVILCERGIRTFETYTRNTLDIAAVPILRELTHLPIIVDPSHAVGLRHAVPTLANAALAVKANGLMVEVHTDPDRSVSDAAQAISPDTFADMMKSLKAIAPAVDMKIS